ncbi:ComEC/Rec2 family competence protein [Rothia halotolerans]|uniref:ComEC/Rec2 family competence protein n=1 Tax=Rothia halotolerans TaxID=405770 RepID=UPI00101C19D9|nr:ComEC/Rec2 family competence protein [Rothia halotolerans]
MRLLPAAGVVWGAAAAVAAGQPAPPRIWALAVLALAVLTQIGATLWGRLGLRPSGRRVLQGATASCVLALVALAAFIAWAGDAGGGAAARLAGAAGSERMFRAVVEPEGEPRLVEGRYGTSQVIDGRVLEADGAAHGEGQPERITLWRQVPSEDDAEPACPPSRPGETEAPDRTASPHKAEDDAGAGRERPRPGSCMLSVIGQVERDGGGYTMRVGALTPVAAPLKGSGGEQGLLPDPLLRGIDRLREGFRQRVEAQLPQDPAALVLGMTYGDDSGLRPETQDALKTSGLTHLTAVSGANVALVFLLGVHSIRWTRCPRPMTLVVGLVAVGAYVVLVGPEPSVLRAAVMGVLGGVTLALGRGGAATSALWVSVIVLLCADRHLVDEPGFILSVLATAGIVLQGAVMSRALVRFMPRMVADPLAVTAVASLWCGPYLVWMTGYWAPFTLLANLLVAPVVPGVTLCGLMALCLQGIAPWSSVLTTTAGVGVRWVEAVGVGAASLPGSRVEAGEGPLPVLLAVVLAVAVALLVFRADPLRDAGRKAMPENLGLSLSLRRDAGEALSKGRGGALGCDDAAGVFLSGEASGQRRDHPSRAGPGRRR